MYADFVKNRKLVRTERIRYTLMEIPRCRRTMRKPAEYKTIKKKNTVLNQNDFTVCR